MTERERFKNEMIGRGDGSVRAGVGITHPVWLAYGEKLDWMESFSEYVHVGISRKPGVVPGYEETDCWGCRWRYPLGSLDGIVVKHPVADWGALDTYRGPDPDAYFDWDTERERVKRQHDAGEVATGGTDHGGIFLRMTYLRGYENFMMDVAERSDEMFRLLDIVENFWMEIARRWVDLGVDQIGFGDDLGLQDRLPMSPVAWRKTIKPPYQRIFEYCRQNGVAVHLHTDGYIVDIFRDLIECGVSSLNPQDLVNGLGNIEDCVKGRAFVDLDIDRQHLTPIGTPDEIDAHIKRCVETLGSPNGGLRFTWGVYPPTPYENIEACVRAMDKYAKLWVK